MAAVETLRLLKQANVGCEEHGGILETRTVGDLVPEWLGLPHTRLSGLMRQHFVERVTLDTEDIEKWNERHENTWGTVDEEEPEFEEESSSEEEVEDEVVSEIVEEDIEDIGPVETGIEEVVEPEEAPAVKKVRRPSTRRSKT